VAESAGEEGLRNGGVGRRLPPFSHTAGKGWETERVSGVSNPGIRAHRGSDGSGLAGHRTAHRNLDRFIQQAGEIARHARVLLLYFFVVEELIAPRSHPAKDRGTASGLQQRRSFNRQDVRRIEVLVIAWFELRLIESPKALSKHAVNPLKQCCCSENARISLRADRKLAVTSASGRWAGFTVSHSSL
jgi:hypothetical protein